MSYSEQLARRVRAALLGKRGVTERKMFGGLAFLLRGRMFCGVLKNDFVVRVGPHRYAEALAQPHTRPMDFTGRPMNGYVYVGPGGCNSASSMRGWLAWATEFVATLREVPPRVGRRKTPARGSKKRGGSQ